MPGAPTVYYGDEVGMTGDDDPDDRRTFPWPDRGGRPTWRCCAHYAALAGAARAMPALTDGDFRMLLADDTAGTVAYGRRTRLAAASWCVNRSDAAHAVEIPVAGYLPDGTSLDVVAVRPTARDRHGDRRRRRRQRGAAAAAAVVLRRPAIDLAPPAAPRDLAVTDEAIDACRSGLGRASPALPATTCTAAR